MISDDAIPGDGAPEVRTRRPGRPRSPCPTCGGRDLGSAHCSTCEGSGLRPKGWRPPGTRRAGNPGKSPDERRVRLPTVRIRGALLDSLAFRASGAGVSVSLYCARVLERHLSQVQ
jgi:hypothetical protein